MKVTKISRTFVICLGLLLAGMAVFSMQLWRSSLAATRHAGLRAPATPVTLPALAAPSTFCNNNGIAIGMGVSNAAPYPSSIAVSGLTGTVNKVTVTVNNFSHPFPDAVDLLLVAPTGANAIIMSDVGGSTCANCPLTLTLDDAAVSALPNSNLPNPLTGGTFQPSNYSSTPDDAWGSPAPSPTGLSGLSGAFNGTNPIGSWHLYVVSDQGTVTGSIGSWCLNIESGAGVCAITQPSNINQAKDANTCGALVTYPAPATTGACGTVDCVPPSGSYFPLGVTTVNCAEAGPGTATASFTVTITGSCPAGQVCNSAPIAISDTGSAQTAAALYPSAINISGLTGQVVNKVTVTLANLSHSFPDKLDLLLVGPQGQTALIMSDAGGGTANAILAANPVTLTLDDAAATALPDTAKLTTGVFQPANYNGGDADEFVSPAPASNGSSVFSVFNGTDPNGTWSLYVVTDGSGSETGQLAGGWCLSVTTSTPAPCAIEQPSNVTQAKDANTCGAVVTYPAPATTGNCGVVSCTPPSGSYFPSGTTTVNCSEQGGSATTSFTVMVTGTCPAGQLCNNAPLTLASGTPAPVAATPYPATLNVTGLTAGISKVTVTLANLNHSFPDSVDLLLVGPLGQTALIMSDVGGGTANAISAANPVTLTLDDEAAGFLPDLGPLTTGTFKPTNIEPGSVADSFPANAPTPSGNTSLSVFNGTDPNGSWQLFAVNDDTGQSGALAGGWCLNFTLAGTLTTLTLDPAGGTMNGQTVLKATLTEKLTGNPVAGQTIQFTLNGSPASPSASAVTNSSGVAMLMANVGALTNGTYPITASFSAANGFVASTASNTLTVAVAPTFSKAFNPTSILLNATAVLTFTINNPNNSPAVMLTGLSFTDTLPAGVTVPNGSTAACGGTLTTTAPGTITLANGSIAGGGNCSIPVTVTGATTGIWTNTLASVSTNETGTTNAPTMAELTVIGPPAIAKAFTPSSILTGNNSTLSLTISNPNTGLILTGVSVTDSFPAGLQVATTPNVINSCATGTFAPSAGNTTISLSNATIPASSSCTFSVQVTPTTGGLKTNTTGNVTSTNGGTGNQGMATLLVNTPPVLTPANLTRAAGSTTANLVIATATDAEDAEATLNVQISSDGQTFGSSATLNNATVTIVSVSATGEVTASIETPCNSTPGAANFSLRVTDAGNLMDTKPWTLTLTANPSPVLSYANQAVTAGSLSSFGPLAGPNDNGTFTPLVLQSVAPATGLSLTLNPANGVINVTSATLAGAYTVMVSTTDNCNAATVATFVVNVVCPTITLTPATLPNANLGAAYQQTFSAGPAGTTYSFAVTAGALPPGLSLASDGNLTGTPSGGGSYSFTVTASGFGGCTGTRTYSLVVVAICPTITLTPASLPGGTVGSAYNQAVSAAGGTGPYTYAITGGALPAGLSLNSSTGAVIGTPTASGTFSFTLTATGAGGCTGSQTYSVTIGCAAITLTPSTLAGAQVGVAYDQTVTANPAGAYTYSLLVGSLPPGLNLNAATGQITGLATATGTYNFTLKVQGAGGCNGQLSYSIVVSCPAITLNPSNPALPNGTVGTAYSQSFSATPSGNYSFAVNGTLPPGLTLNSASGVLSGTPTTSGAYSFTVRATGFGTCTGSRTYSLTITANCATITLPALPATGTVNVNYSGNLAATTPAASYTFTVDSGALPPGLVINNLFGQLSGKPTAAGVYNFTLKATRSNGCSGTRAYTITVGSSLLALRNDFDGDGKSDLVLRRPGSGVWVVTLSGTGETQFVTLGNASDLPAFGDYDGDGRTDLAVYRRAEASWLLRLSSSGESVEWRVSNTPADAQLLPLAADFDGDGRTDLALWESATASWFVQRSTDGKQLSFQFGTAGDIAVPADYDGDGRADLAVFQPESARWRIQQSSDGADIEEPFGSPKDAPLTGDFDGDGRAELGVWRSAEGALYLRGSVSQQTTRLSVGLASAADWLLLGDYDGDGLTEVAVWRAADATWHLRLQGSQHTDAIRRGSSGSTNDRPARARKP